MHLALCFAFLAEYFSSTGATKGTLGKECQNYLSVKGLANPEQLATAFGSGPCSLNASSQQYAPDPVPRVPGAYDTTNMTCRYGNPAMFSHCGTCCGLRPHFNWIVATCEETQGTGQFCANLPRCVIEGSPKINYVAAYQFDGTEFVLLDESSAGEIKPNFIEGDFWKNKGFSAEKENFRWRGGDWTTKYAPWAHSGIGSEGPRGVTPPAGLFILSAENFYYGAFYMLSQLGINLDGLGQPTGTNCWTWELDPVEGTAGWDPGAPLPGNLNMLYRTGNAQASGCMPVSYSSRQSNGMKDSFQFPEEFRAYCAANPEETGCQPWRENIGWGGGKDSSHRFENLWDEPYVFAVVIDSQGYWTYRWRPRVYGQSNLHREMTSNASAAGEQGGTQTGWPGVERFRAARTLPARPNPVRDPAGLRTDVPGHVAEAVIFQPGLSEEASCLRASIEDVNWQFGSDALAAMAKQLGEDGPGGRLFGAQNWWASFADTKQNANYPLSIAGIDGDNMHEPLQCRDEESFSCSCQAYRDAELLQKESEAVDQALFV